MKMEVTGPYEGKYRVNHRIQQRSATNWFYVHEINDKQIDSASKALMQRYSRYKYGDIGAIMGFSNELGALVRSLGGIDITDQPDNWVLFTPPYSTVESAVRPLGDRVASAFAIPHIDFRTSPNGDRNAQYAGITDVQARIQAKLSVQVSVPDKEAVRGKKALVVDDMITTGATAAYMDHVLYTNLGLKEVRTVVLIDLTTETPELEEEINRDLISSDDLQELIDILNDSHLPINRHILKSLCGEDRGVLNAIRGNLLPSVLERMQVAEMLYYGRNPGNN